jgi:hypothetical protein
MSEEHTVPPTESALPAESADEAQANVRASDRADEAWLSSLLRPVLIVLLVVSLDVLMVTLLTRFMGDAAPWFLPSLLGLAVVAAVVGSATTTVLAQPAQRIHRSALYRLAELGLFVVLARVVVWVTQSGVPNIQQMMDSPMETLIDPLFVVCGLIVALSWSVSVEITDDMNQLALRGDEILMGKWRSDRFAGDMRAAGVDRRSILQYFTFRWATLGLFAIVLAALLRRDMTYESMFSVMRQGVEPAVMTALIVYFVAGLLLISQGQLAGLRSRWTLEKAQTSPSVVRSWPVHLVVVMGIVVFVSLFLPLGGTFLLARVLTSVIGALFAVILFAYNLIGFALLWLVSLVAGDEPPPRVVMPQEEMVISPPPEAMPSILPPWAPSAFFWLAVVALVAYAAFVYFHDRGVRFAWLSWLIQILKMRWFELRRAVRSVRLRAALAVPAFDASRVQGGRFGWLRGQWQTPDEWVRYVYLAMLHEADQSGIARRPSETPLGYAPRLQGQLPEEGQAADVEVVTEAFVENRYGGSHADEALADDVRGRLRALQRALRLRRP